MKTDRFNSRPQSELEQIARKVRVLRNFTKDTGFFTSRSVGSLLSNLSPDELVTVIELSDTKGPDEKES